MTPHTDKVFFGILIFFTVLTVLGWIAAEIVRALCRAWKGRR